MLRFLLLGEIGVHYLPHHTSTVSGAAIAILRNKMDDKRRTHERLRETA